VKLFVVCLGVFVGARTASAELPKWCGKTDNKDLDKYALNDLKRTEADDVVRAIARTRCSSSAELAPMQGQIDQARAAWGKKLGMTEDDWADAVAFIDNRDGNYPKVDLSTKDMAQFTPMDQWQAIKNGLGNDSVKGGAQYVTDALDSRLTEVGRLAWLEFCLAERVEHSYMAHHAVCNADVEAWSWDKFSKQLHGDTAHDGGTKMLLRFRALEMNDKLGEYKTERGKLFKADEEYKKVFDVAAKARSEWAKGIGSNTKLLDLVLAMDAGSFAGSRKMLADCDGKTTPELQAAISKIPAKSFSGMADVRDDPFAGFAHQAGPVLVNNAQVNLAANAWAQCHRGTPTADWLMASLQEVPGVRGPRGAAVGAILNEKFTFDDVNARPMQHPDVGNDVPYSRSGGTPSSAGGVVDKVTVKGGIATVTLQKTKVKTLDCVKSHSTNRVTRIRSDGSLEYQSICDKSAMVEHDTTWADFKINAAFAPILKKGVLFSSYGNSDDKGGDVIATWANKTATTPSTVLGAKVK
jgi:hypothetical protein